MIRALSLWLLLVLVNAASADITTGLIFAAPCQDHSTIDATVAATPANGTLTGAGNTSASSVMGPGGTLPRALEFDGIDDYVTTSSVTASGDEATYAMFVKLDGNQGAFDGLLLCRGSGSNVCGLHISDAGGRELGCTWNDDFNTYNWNSGVIIPDNVWCLVAATVTATNITVYVISPSGSPSNVNTVTNSSCSFAQSPQIMRDSFSSRFAKGSVAGARIYNRDLTEDDLVELYNFGRLSRARGGISRSRQVNGDY